MSKLGNRLSRLHQSRVRAVEESQDRPSGVFHADPPQPTAQPTAPNQAWRAAGADAALCFHHTFSTGHGRFSQHALKTDLPHAWTKQTTLLDATPAHQVAYLDIETNGLDARAFAFCIGVGSWNQDAFQVQQFIVPDTDHEPAILQRLAAQLQGFDALVTFNGQSFDVPRLQARFDLHGLPSPFQRLQHIDLLVTARRLLPPGALNLSALERTFLDFHRVGDIPGSEAPSRCQAYARTGAVAQLMPLFEHNALDILSLAALQAAFKELLLNPMPRPKPTPRPAQPAPQPAQPAPQPASSAPLTELQAKLQKTYRLKSGRSVRRQNPPSTAPQPTSIPHIGHRINALRQQVTPLLADLDYAHALPILFEMVALAPTNAYPIAELARYYRSVGELDLAQTFEARLQALGMAL